ncbi:MAG TPA: c-type cytochrome [Bryobacteraceae bacterium]|jgi:mono/diheme cytochrome c family protein|nr:c-type cytochrome [Bryobacteraceae bacterium]
MNKLTKLSLTGLLLLAGTASQSTKAQEKQAKKTAESTNLRNPALIERGKYIVESVAMCERCHTPRDENGNPERSNWLKGGPVQLKQTYPTPTWAEREPRIAGAPPGTDEQFITLLTTGISRTGAPPNLPMPPFRMTRQDAEAVLAYLKSLR